MTTYLFLSPEWIEAARRLHTADTAGDGAEDDAGVSIKMNLSVESAPFGDGTVAAHVDTSSGVLEIALGHLENPDVTVHLDYPTARAVLVDGNGDAAMAAFMAGKIRVEGDIGKLLTYQTTPPSPRQLAMAAALREMTDHSA